MNLAVDIGNTQVKLGVFDGEEMILQRPVHANEFDEALDLILKTHNIRQTIICATGNSEKIATSIKDRGLSVSVLDQKTPVPFKNLYETPQTLGVDRIALMAGAAHKFAGSNVLVIDAGTCITYDFLNKQNEYLGGAIAPGVSMRYKAMHEFTHALPLLSFTKSEKPYGANTQQAMHAGVFTGLIAEIDAQMDWYKSNYERLKIVLTGGDVQFLSNSLKNDIFADSNFLLQGLNYILLFNTHQ